VGLPANRGHDPHVALLRNAVGREQLEACLEGHQRVSLICATCEQRGAEPARPREAGRHADSQNGESSKTNGQTRAFAQRPAGWLRFRQRPSPGSRPVPDQIHPNRRGDPELGARTVMYLPGFPQPPRQLGQLGRGVIPVCAALDLADRAGCVSHVLREPTGRRDQLSGRRVCDEKLNVAGRASSPPGFAAMAGAPTRMLGAEVSSRDDTITTPPLVSRDRLLVPTSGDPALALSVAPSAAGASDEHPMPGPALCVWLGVKAIPEIARNGTEGGEVAIPARVDPRHEDHLGPRLWPYVIVPAACLAPELDSGLRDTHIVSP
jgi:hypothetical protein